MKVNWDYSRSLFLSNQVDWSFLDWTSTEYLDERGTISDISMIEPSWGGGYVDGEGSVSYADRITYTDGTAQYSLLGQNLDETGTDTYWFDSKITAITYNNDATGERWIVTFKRSELTLPDLQDLYDSVGAAGVTAALFSGRNNFVGSEDADSVIGFLGDDKIFGCKGDDTLSGADGDDTLKGQSGNDSLNGDDGDDILRGGSGNDSLSGGAGNDRLSGGRDDDILYGNEGNDTLSAGSGTDVLYGGTGDDKLAAGSYNAIHSTLYGDEGNDTLVGGRAETSLLYGGEGDDRLTASWTYGQDLQMYGGEGNDTLISKDNGDLLLGGDGDDRLRGNWGDDTLRGGSGEDTVIGDSGDDKLFGGDGDDSLSGGGWDDTLRGGAGADTLSGGYGEDVFVFANSDEGALILDFETGEDTILLEGMTGLEDTVSYAVAVIDSVGEVPEGEYAEILHLMVGDLTLQFVGTGLSVTEADLVFT